MWFSSNDHALLSNKQYELLLADRHLVLRCFNQELWVQTTSRKLCTASFNDHLHICNVQCGNGARLHQKGVGKGVGFCASCFKDGQAGRQA